MSTTALERPNVPAKPSLRLNETTKIRGCPGSWRVAGSHSLRGLCGELAVYAAAQVRVLDSSLKNRPVKAPPNV